MRLPDRVEGGQKFDASNLVPVYLGGRGGGLLPSIYEWNPFVIPGSQKSHMGQFLQEGKFGCFVSYFIYIYFKK